MRVVRVEALPERALEAAAEFHARVVPGLKALFDPPQDGEDLTIIFPPAPYDHRGWRLAAVQDIARAAAPVRINGIVGDNQAAIDDTLEYLAKAPGVTGQLLAV